MSVLMAQENCLRKATVREAKLEAVTVMDVTMDSLGNNVTVHIQFQAVDEV